MSAPDDDKYFDDLDDDKHLSEILEILKQKSDDGNKAAVLLAVYQCALRRKPLPEWLRAAFIYAYESAARFEIRSWDEAFGSPHNEKNVQLTPRKQHAELRYPIAFHVHRLWASGRPIDKGIFVDVAKALKKDDVSIEPATVEKIYYKRGGKELHEMLRPLLPGRATKNPTKN